MINTKSDLVRSTTYLEADSLGCLSLETVEQSMYILVVNIIRQSKVCVTLFYFSIKLQVYVIE